MKVANLRNLVLVFIAIGCICFGYAEIHFRQAALDAASKYLSASMSGILSIRAELTRWRKTGDTGSFVAEGDKVLKSQIKAHNEFVSATRYFPLHLHSIRSCVEESFAHANTGLSGWLSGPTANTSDKDIQAISGSFSAWDQSTLACNKLRLASTISSAKDAAMQLISGTESTKNKVAELASKAGSLSGIGKGLAIEQKNHSTLGTLKWVVEGNGGIRAWNEKNGVEISMTPALQGGSVTWTCRGYPKAAMPSSCGGDG